MATLLSLWFGFFDVREEFVGLFANFSLLDCEEAEDLELRNDFLPIEVGGGQLQKLDVCEFDLLQVTHQVAHLRVEVDVFWKFLERNVPVIEPDAPVDEPAGSVELAGVGILFHDPA